MEFANFALIELAGALEAQRAHDRKKNRWLLLWRELHGDSDVAPAQTDSTEPESVRPAA